jgi:hypothetical protein
MSSWYDVCMRVIVLERAVDTEHVCACLGLNNVLCASGGYYMHKCTYVCTVAEGVPIVVMYICDVVHACIC